MEKKTSLISLINDFSKEKNIDKKYILETIKKIIIYTIKKKYGNIKVIIQENKKNKTLKVFQLLKVVENSIKYNPLIEIPLKDTDKRKNRNFVKKEIDFKTIDKKIIRKKILNKINNVKKKNTINELKKNEKKLILCTIKEVYENKIILDIGNNLEGILKKENTITKDTFIPGKKILAYLAKIKNKKHKTKIYLSRTCNELVIELLNREIPEIKEEIIKIKNIARNPGIRTKISITTENKNLDPIGACIGIRKTRIQAISNELCGEKIDIILWNNNPIKHAINALSKIEILSIEIDEELKIIDLIIQEDNMSKIVGKNGNNIKLINKIIGWKINVISNNYAKEKYITECKYLTKLFTSKLNIDVNTANLLIKEGFTSLEEIAYLPNNEANKLKSINKNYLINLKNKTKTILFNP